MFGRFLDWLQREAQNPSRLFLLGGLAVVIWVVGSLGFFRELMHSAAALLCVLIPFLFCLALMIAAVRPPKITVGQGSTLRQDAKKPGARRWPHNIYDENAYAILGVPQDATRAEIRAAYRKLVQHYHPDVVPTEEKERAALIFVHVDLAFEILSHPKNRIRYDAWIEVLFGREPPLDVACATFKDADALAKFDTVVKPDLSALDVPECEANVVQSEAQELRGEFSSPPPTDNVPDQVSPDAPLELEMPDTVREAMKSRRSEP